MEYSLLALEDECWILWELQQSCKVTSFWTQGSAVSAVIPHFKATALSSCSPLGFILKRFKLWVAQRQLCNGQQTVPGSCRCIQRAVKFHSPGLFHHPPAMPGQQQSLTVPFCPISLTQAPPKHPPSACCGTGPQEHIPGLDQKLPLALFTVLSSNSTVPSTSELLAPPHVPVLGVLGLCSFSGIASTWWQIFSSFP